MGIAELAHELRMSRPTVHRYAATLVSLGYLEQDRSRRYRLAAGGADVGLALLGAMPLRALAHEHLRGLRGKTGHTVALAVLDEADVRFVDWLRGWRAGQHALNHDLGLGTRLPSHCTAMGKALLAYLPEHTRERLIAALRLVSHGPNTITARRALRAELEHVRAAGLAVNDEELSPGLRTLAVPLLDAHGLAPAAIGVAVPCESYSREELVAKLGPAVVAAATRIATVMRAQPGEGVLGERFSEGMSGKGVLGAGRQGRKLLR